MFILLITVAFTSAICMILNCIFSGSLLILINKILAVFLNVIFLLWIIQYFGKTYISEVRKLIKKLLRLFKR